MDRHATRLDARVLCPRRFRPPKSQPDRDGRSLSARHLVTLASALSIAACNASSVSPDAGTSSSGASSTTTIGASSTVAEAETSSTTTAQSTPTGDTTTAADTNASGCTVTWGDGASTELLPGETATGFRHSISADCEAIANEFTCSGRAIDTAQYGEPTCDAPDEWSSTILPSQLNLYAEFDKQATTNTLSERVPWGAMYDVTQDGTVVGRAALFSDDDNIVLEWVTEASGEVRYALELRSPQLRTLELGTPDYDGGPVQAHYPYNWGIPHPESPVEPELLVPGVMARDPSGAWVVVAHRSTQLFRIDLSLDGPERRARFFRQTESASGSDRSIDSHAFEAGDVDRLVMSTADGVRSIQRKRLGTPHTMSGLITQAPHRGWSSEAGYLTAETYADMAATVAQGGIEHIMLRLNEPEAWVSDIFTDEGLTTHYYLFLGVARLRRLEDGNHCYSIRFAESTECVDGSTGELDWVLRDSNADIYTASINPSWAFLDLRVPAYRDALVDRAVRAVDRGFGGIFFDGPQLWGGGARSVFVVGGSTAEAVAVPGDAIVGGVNESGQAMSWYNARALLVQQTRDAIRQLDPDAYVGILGNEYVDYQAATDYVLKEVVNWTSLADDPRCRTLNYGAMEAALEAEEFGHLYQFYAPQRVLALKGNNADAINDLHDVAADIGVGSLGHGDPATQLKYIGIADFTATYADAWASVIQGVAGSMLSPPLAWPANADCPP